ncbi:Pycsar system effector family protein [Haloarcula sp. KBTZ06]|uniref:Pycsar system effector family protein n=1 Tax=Haloarcula sp. KBTZ06 TaxID=3402682 RepID=UPI003B42C28C
MTDRNQFIVEALAQTKSSIRSADQKASMLLTGQFAFLGLFANVVAPIWKDGGPTFHRLTALTTIAAFGSILAAAVVVFPREGDGDLLYFAENADKNKEKYVEEIMELDAENRSKELLRSDHSLSTIANRKHSYVRISVIGAVLSVCFGVIAITAFMI